MNPDGHCTANAQGDLSLEMDAFHPYDCPCGQCEAELIELGTAPIQLTPLWVLQIDQCHEAIAVRRGLGLIE